MDEGSAEHPGTEFGNATSLANEFDTLMEISDLLNTGLDSEELLMCSKLLDSGVNPVALAMMVHTAKQARINVSQ